MHIQWIVLAALLLLFPIVWAHEPSISGAGTNFNLTPELQLAQTFKNNSYNVVGVTAIVLIILILYAIFAKPRKEKTKKILFWSIATVSMASILFLAGSTVYLNMVSPNGGPVHWHADFEIWNCGEKLDLIDPTGLDNRVGTWEVHEHNDDRMHVEGTIVDMGEASFHHFFETTGSVLDETEMTYPATQGNIFMPVKGTCDGQPAELQGYLVHVIDPQNAKNWHYTQEKIAYPFEKIMAPYSNVPPGDCLIVEYGPVSATTTHVCASYRAAEYRGELDGR